jgi:hypothetical protein
MPDSTRSPKNAEALINAEPTHSVERVLMLSADSAVSALKTVSAFSARSALPYEATQQRMVA